MKADTGLLLCTGVNTFFLCVRIHMKLVSGPVSLMYCYFFVFSRHVWVSVFHHPCHGHSEPHKAFFCIKSEEG